MIPTILSSIVFFTSLAFSSLINVNLVGKHVKDVYALELKRGGTWTPNQALKMQDGEVYLAETYLHEEESLPNLEVYYYYSSKDSLVNQVLYEWDMSACVDSANSPQPKEFNEFMIDRFLRLKETLNKEFGEGVTTGSVTQLSAIETIQGLKCSTVWKESGTEAELSIVLRNYFMKSGLTTLPTVHRIRLYIK